MNDEKENAGLELATAPTTDEGNATENSEEKVVAETTKRVETTTQDPRSFTQEQVNDFVRQRIDRERKQVYSRYGVADRAGLDELVGKAQSYDVMKERIEKIREENAEMIKKVAFIENNISDEKIDDVLTYFKGKGIDLNSEALKVELATHPEWLKAVIDDKPITTIKNISAERGKVEGTNEKEEMAKLFGVRII